MGNVKSFKGKTERILKANKNSAGYLGVVLYKYNKMKTLTVHKLVAMLFLNHIPDGHNICVDHRNNIPTDNRVGNLQLISHRENISKDKKDGSSKYTGVCWDKIKKQMESSN